MKTKLFIEVAILAIWAGLVTPILVWGQVSSSGDKFYATSEACLGGARNYYTPKFLSLHNKNPADGVKIVVAPLESDACVYMQVVGGYAWVWRRAGDKFRWNKNSDGALSIRARDDCGNDAPRIVYPTPPQQLLVGPVMRGPAGPAGPPGRDGQDFRPNLPFLGDTLERKGGFPTKRVMALMFGIAGGTYLLLQRNNKQQVGPTVTSDSSRVTRCVATSYPNTCPSGPEVGRVAQRLEATGLSIVSRGRSAGLSFGFSF